MDESSHPAKERAPPLRALERAAPFFVVASLVLLLLAPLAIGARVLDVRASRSDVQEPARVALDTIELTTVSQAMALRAYAALPPPTGRAFAEEYWRARAVQRDALEVLTPLLPHLGSDTRASVIELRRALLAWHESHEALVDDDGARALLSERLPAQQELASAAIARSRAALESLADEVETTRARLFWLTRLHVLLTAALAALALLSIFAALWLGDRGRRLDVALEERALAEELAKARADVLSWVSHDLKNPLAAIRMACTNLRRILEKAPERAPRVVDSIDRSSLRMHRLIGDLLDSARLDAGRALVMDTRAVDLGALLARTCDEMERQPGVEVKVRCELPEELPAVHGDKLRLEQALLNLVQNAIRVSPSEGTVRVAAEREAGRVRVSVSDEGPGVPADVVPRLFQPFRAARRSDSTGLGLAIVKGVVEAHGGDVWLQTGSGEGTTFFFTLPLHVPHAVLVDDGEPDAAEARPTSEAGGPPP